MFSPPTPSIPGTDTKLVDASTAIAVREGLESAAAALVASSAAVLALNHYAPSFKRNLGVSGKVFKKMNHLSTYP